MIAPQMQDISQSPTGNLKRILVLGNGPSLKKKFFPLFKDIDTIGMNAAYRYWQQIDWWPTYYACLDDRVVLSHLDAIVKMIEEGRCKKFFLHHGILEIKRDILKYDDVFFLCQFLQDDLNRRECIRLGIEPIVDVHFRTGFPEKLTTGSYATRFVAMLGYREIGLIGIDARYVEIIPEATRGEGLTLRIDTNPDKNPNYFFDEYQVEGDIYNVPNPSVHNGNLHLQSFLAIKDDFKDSIVGSHIYICTEESELFRRRVFPYLRLDKFLNPPRLSAIFVPFTRFDLPMLRRRLQIWGSWEGAPYEGDGRERSVELHLAFNHRKDPELEAVLEEEFRLANLGRFFDGPYFDYSELEGQRDLYTKKVGGPAGPEGYMAGPNNQFFDIIGKFSQGMSHVALVEPDVAPIRAGWLEAMERIVSQSEKFWICGSQYRGIWPIGVLWHVNGNAIYNVGDHGFQKFYKEVFIPSFYERAKIKPNIAYDVMMFHIFKDVFSSNENMSAQMLWAECAHRIRFSEFIVNISLDEDKKPENVLGLDEARRKFPDSYLVHGAVAGIDEDLRRREARNQEMGADAWAEPLAHEGADTHGRLMAGDGPGWPHALPKASVYERFVGWAMRRSPVIYRLGSFGMWCLRSAWRHVVIVAAFLGVLAILIFAVIAARS